MNSLLCTVGARACLGRRYEQIWLLTWRSIYVFFISRFFETEGIAVIMMMVWKYRVEVKQEPEHVGETREQCFARITASEQYTSHTYAMSSLLCLLRTELVSAPTAYRLYSRGDDYLPETLFYYMLTVS